MSNKITVRNRRFATTATSARANSDAAPIADAFYSSLSATFPLGETFFVRSVAHFAKQVPAGLKLDVEAFIRQEANHSREHAHFNAAIAGAGLPVENATAYASQQIDMFEQHSPMVRLAVTVGLEHFTSVFAQIILRDPAHLSYCDPQSKALWHWHAVEEIEHKAVAYDVFNHVTKDWSALKRWSFRSIIMVETMARLGCVVWKGTGDILRSQGQTSSGWRFRVLAYLFVTPGLLTSMGGLVMRFFVPGFHPNQIDEGDLLVIARAALDPLSA
jgi:uncharacterized protein